MKNIFLGPQGPKWADNGLRMIERWINTLSAFRGSAADRDGADGLVPQPLKGEQNFVLHGDGKFRAIDISGGGTPPASGGIPIYGTDGTITNDTDFYYDATSDTLYAPHIVSDTVVADIVTVDPETYGPGWDGDNSVPTKNDVYDAIQALPSSAPVPVSFTSAPFNIDPPAKNRQEFPVTIAPTPLLVGATTKGVWLTATIEGTGKVNKKLIPNYPWKFEVQLKAGPRYIPLGTATVTIPSNGKTYPFKLSLFNVMSRPAAGSYGVVLISDYTGPIVTGKLTVNLMLQAP